MNPEISAAVIGVIGALFLALISNAAASIYFAGKMAQRVSDIDRRLTATEEVVRDVLMRKAGA